MKSAVSTQESILTLFVSQVNRAIPALVKPNARSRLKLLAAWTIRSVDMTEITVRVAGNHMIDVRVCGTPEIQWQIEPEVTSGR